MRTHCCVGGEIKEKCGGSCCDEDEFCCGDQDDHECCGMDEVCCWNPIDGYYCNPPCSGPTLINTSCCSEDNEETHQCIGCLMDDEGPCDSFTYLDFTGLHLYECYNGCDHFIVDKICYEEKKCSLSGFKTDNMCLECDTGRMCSGSITGGPFECQYGDGLACAIVIAACEITFTCFECDEGDGDVVDTFTLPTCVACL
jgi:hypothetical protein